MMYPLTIPQENIWNLQKFYSDSSISNISGLLVFDKKRDLNLLKEAVNAFIRNQDGIRLHFTEKGGEACQSVTAFEPADIPVLHFADLDEAEEFFKKEGRKPFSLVDSVMYRFYIFDTPSQCGICPCMSHLVADAWTLSLFCEKVITYYHLLEQDLEMEEETVSYVDHIWKEAEYIRSERYIRDASYWEHRFLNKPEISYIKPACARSKSVRAGRLTRTIGLDMTGRLREWCTERSISLAVVFEAVVLAYLYRINDSLKETWVGVPVLNRATCHEKETAGMFISTMPLGIAVSGEDTADSLCEKIAVSHREMFRHQRYPYSHILKHIRERFGPVENLYDVMVSYQNAKIKCITNDGFYTKWLHNGYSEIPLALHIDDRDGRGSLTVNMDYQLEVFSSGEAELLYNRLYFILSQFIGNEQITMSGLQIMPENEYQKVVYDFNDTVVEYPRDKCVHELFRELAASCPDKIALVFEEQQFTYRQLDEMSNSLGHYLRSVGVKPNDIVPIIAKRSWHIIVAMLGILKAGGAYLLIDPDYPNARIAYLIEETESRMALCYGIQINLQVPVIDLAIYDFTAWTDMVANVNTSNDIYCALQTSGSTGVPKLALLTHKNLCNYIYNKSDMFSSVYTAISFTSVSFDAFLVDTINEQIQNIAQ